MKSCTGDGVSPGRGGVSGSHEPVASQKYQSCPKILPPSRWTASAIAWKDGRCASG